MDEKHRTELFRLLCRCSPTMNRPWRDGWVMRLPEACRRQVTHRTEDRETDLTFIIDALQDVRTEDGCLCIVPLIDDLLQWMQGTTLEGEMRALREAIQASSALLFSGEMPSAETAGLFAQLGEWKLIHRESQSLLNSLRIPLGYLLECHYRPHPTTLDSAGLKWQELCAPRLGQVPASWDLKLARTPCLDTLAEQTSQLGDITMLFFEAEPLGRNFKELCFHVEKLYGTLWDLLTVADAKITLLISNLRATMGA